MNILITNDDGWGSQGITALVECLRPLGHITVMAPDGARSGMSNAISACQTINLKKIATEFEEVEVYTTTGTPSDCIKLAIDVLFGGDSSRIDLVVSGINHGSNASINLIYSGTMGACFVAAEHGIKAIGYSIYDNDRPTDLQYFLPYIPRLTQELLSKSWHAGLCYNVNAPKGPIRGTAYTRQCRGHWAEEMVIKEHREQEDLYTLQGYFINDEPQATDTDEYAIGQGKISIQPCSVDMTDYRAIDGAL